MHAARDRPIVVPVASVRLSVCLSVCLSNAGILSKLMQMVTLLDGLVGHHSIF